MTSGFKEFKKKVERIAFTDSVHVLPSRNVPQEAQKWITKVRPGVHYIVL
jgi:hypothetical protein